VYISRVFSIAFCLMAVILATVTVANSRETTSRIVASAPSNATIYLIRPKGIIPAASFQIKVDDRAIGALPPGAYFVLSQPRGRHTLEIAGGILGTGWQSEIEFNGGQTYFIEIGPHSYAPGTQLLHMVLAGTSGQLLPGRGSPFSHAYRFFSLDAEHGRAAIAGLTKLAR
jgi:hypothetical protein